jgi:aspartate aminotransferase
MNTRTDALADRMDQIALSPTMRGTMEADRLRRSGVAVIDLGAGEPDFPTPDHIVAAAHEALNAQFTKYTANPGIMELRQAIADRYRGDYGIDVGPENVIATAGGKQALFHAAEALFNPGDDVITHTPGWPTIVEQIKMAGAKPVIVRTHIDDGFDVRADALVDAITPRTRAIVINSPGNPTGALLSEADAERLAAEAARRGLWVIIDLCYERLVYDEVPPYPDTRIRRPLRC